MKVLTNDQRILSLLGVAKKARRLVCGQDTVANSLSSNKIHLVFVAKDASFNTKDKFIKKCYYYNVPLNQSFTCLELSSAIGKEGIKVLAVSDKGIAESVEKLLKEGVKYES